MPGEDARSSSPAANAKTNYLRLVLHSPVNPYRTLFEMLLLPNRDFRLHTVYRVKCRSKRRSAVWSRRHDRYAGFSDRHRPESVHDRDAADLMALRQICSEFSHRSDCHWFEAVVLQVADGLAMVVIPYNTFKYDNGSVDILLGFRETRPRASRRSRVNA